LVPAPVGEQQREGSCRGGKNRSGEPDPGEPVLPAGEPHAPEGRAGDCRRESSPTEGESHPRIILPPGLDGPGGKAAAASSRHRKRRLWQATPQSMIASRSAIATACV